MGDAVGDVGGVFVRQKIDQTIGRGTRVDKDKVAVMHQRRRVLRDSGLFFKHLPLAAFKGRFRHAGSALDRRRSAEHLLELAHLVEIIQIAADGGLRGFERLGQFRYGDGVALAEYLQNGVIPFLCQHDLAPLEQIIPYVCLFMIIL